MKRKPGQKIKPHEYKKHRDLKEFGKIILKSIGAKNICLEKEIDTTYIMHKTKFGGRYYVDVYGEIRVDNKIIPLVMECGNIISGERMNKLQKTGCIIIFLGNDFITKLKGGNKENGNK